jgi:signal peptidase II
MNELKPKIPFSASGLSWWWIALIVVVLDQVTKFWIVTAIPEKGGIYVLPVFNIIHTYNPGAAWSMFANFGGAQRWFLSALAIVVSVFLVYWLRGTVLAAQRLLSFGLTLILGGAIGNVIDRLRLGHVVDFLELHWDQSRFPAFNVADSAITIGAFCVIYDIVRETLRERRLKRAAASAGK